VDSTVTGAIAIGAVVLIALAARATSGRRDESITAEDALSEGAIPPTEASEAAADPDGDARTDPEDQLDGGDATEVAAVTSDGCALLPDTHAVRLVPPLEEGEAWKAGESARNRRGERALLMSWHAGDFTGARVVRGAADEGPWRFEALGRDGEYTAFAFETREGADAALALFESRGVIRLGRDEEGRAVPPSPEQFEEARRVFLETEAALELDDEESR
jgi:hypothetical protein